MSDELLAYCVKCKTKRTMIEARPIFTSNGTPASQGICPECDTRLTRFGATQAHEGMQRPEVQHNSKGKRSKKSTSSARKKTASRKSTRSKKLVVVESPAKARTISRFLGNEYTVRASIGHVRDLLRSRLSVDVDNDFEPSYRVPNDKRDVVKQLKKDVDGASEIYMATDPDREGEAIAWHLIEATEAPKERVKRVVFHEITKPAIDEAFAQPRGIDMELVEAQQARRILDRLVGYSISPLLWKRVRSRTSAGRVQSVALRLVVERERDIEQFTAEEYWSIEAELAKVSNSNVQPPTSDHESFIAKLIRTDDQDVDLKSRQDTESVVQVLETARYAVKDVREGTRRRNASPPFTTSTLQQEASRRLGFTARRTMAMAQALYEGIPMGDEGNTGLITYMRTDSTQVSPLAQKEARDYIAKTYGTEYMPTKPRQHKTRRKSAQEAHEAIRPTSVMRTPQQVRDSLSRDQFRLYELIWRRFVASQMSAAVYDTIAVDVEALPKESPGNGATSQQVPSRYLFRATGSTVRFTGFLAVYQESRGDDEEEEKSTEFPPLTESERLNLVQLLPEQHFTQPPPRYTEATLVRTLEENGIGRPSTYAPTLSTIQARGYVDRIERRRLQPTELGFIVNDLVVKHFPEQVDIGFTAQMEETLDEIAQGKQDWVATMRDFYEPFAKAVAEAEKTMESAKDLLVEETDEVCEKCGSPMIIKFGRYGKFLACSNYPTCRNTRPIVQKTGAICPKDGGDLVQRRSRRGRVFYGCSNYPACDFTSWSRPLPTPCPNCGNLLVVQKQDMVSCIECHQEFSLDQIQSGEETTAEVA